MPTHFFRSATSVESLAIPKRGRGGSDTFFFFLFFLGFKRGGKCRKKFQKGGTGRVFIFFGAPPASRVSQFPNFFFLFFLGFKRGGKCRKKFQKGGTGRVFIFFGAPPASRVSQFPNGGGGDPTHSFFFFFFLGFKRNVEKSFKRGARAGCSPLNPPLR